jgi:hypothetical protein
MALVTPTHEKGWCSFAITGQVAHTADAAGSVGYIVNPEACTIIVTNCIAYISASSTAACNLTVGTATTIAGAHDTHTMFDAAAMGAAAGTAVVGEDYGDPADSLPVIASGSVIAAFCSADSSGLAGVVFVEYLRVND